MSLQLSTPSITAVLSEAHRHRAYDRARATPHARAGCSQDRGETRCKQIKAGKSHAAVKDVPLLDQNSRKSKLPANHLPFTQSIDSRLKQGMTDKKAAAMYCKDLEGLSPTSGLQP